MPGSPSTVANFLRHLHKDKGLRSSTICKVARSAVGDLHRFEVAQPHSTTIVEQVCKIIKAKAKGAKPRKEPIRSAIVSALVTQLDLLDDDSLMTATMMIFSYKGFLRSSECTSLGEADVWLETILVQGLPTKVLFIFIEKSKTDQERVGHTVVLGMDIKNPWKCPVRHFRALRGRRRKGAKSFFHNRKGGQLPPKNVNVRLKKLCTLAGLDPKKYSSHGLRAGGATEAAANGIRTHLIKRHGHWKSSAVYIYIRDDVEQQLSVSSAI